MLACEETVGKQRGPFQLQSKRRGGCSLVVLRLSNQDEHAPLFLSQNV